VTKIKRARTKILVAHKASNLRAASLLSGGTIPTFYVLARGDVSLPWRISVYGEIAGTSTRAANGLVGHVLRGLVQRKPSPQAHVRRTGKEVSDSMEGGIWIVSSSAL